MQQIVAVKIGGNRVGCLRALLYRMEHFVFFLPEEIGRGFSTALRYVLASFFQALGRRRRRLPNSLVKDALEVSLCERRALEVFVCPNFLGADESLLV